MKKLYTSLLVVALLLSVLAGCQSNEKLQQYPTTTAPMETTAPQEKNVPTTEPEIAYITAEEAKNIALQDAGLKESEVRELEVELDKDNGAVHYNVDIEKDNQEYDRKIDALTGEILQEQEPADERPTEPPVASTASVENTAPQKETLPATVPETAYITAEEAKNIALQDAGLKESEVRELEVELDKDRDNVHYDVDFEKIIKTTITKSTPIPVKFCR